MFSSYVCTSRTVEGARKTDAKREREEILSLWCLSATVCKNRLHTVGRIAFCKVYFSWSRGQKLMNSICNCVGFLSVVEEVRSITFVYGNVQKCKNVPGLQLILYTESQCSSKIYESRKSNNIFSAKKRMNEWYLTNYHMIPNTNYILLLTNTHKILSYYTG